MRPRTLPGVVHLPPDAPLMSAGHVQASLGASRALLSLWRRERGFPPSHRSRGGTYTFTDDVKAWCLAHGVQVKQ